VATRHGKRDTRKHHHRDLTFSLVYAFSENFLLPFSHDEVVHGKRSLLSKMPGNEGQQFANLRALYGYMYAHPGKKLHFMGSEFGPRREWSESTELDWGLLANAPHRQLVAYVRDLNRLYTERPALYELDFGWEGFQWVDCSDAERSIVSFIRRGKSASSCVVVVTNFTPVSREGYRLGVPAAGSYAELLNSDSSEYGGTNVRNTGPIVATLGECGGQPYSIAITLPPLSILVLENAALSGGSNWR
jgi:1,4-alpha-glucan branching enzyme